MVTWRLFSPSPTLLERVKEHAYKDQESAVNKHLNSCYDTNFLDSKTNNELTDFVMTNLLLYKEAIRIKRRKSIHVQKLRSPSDFLSTCLHLYSSTS